MDKKEIIIFGTGKYFDYKRHAIEKKYKIVCFLDNKVAEGSENTNKEGGIKVMNPRDLERKGTLPIFLMSVHFVSMWRQLVQLGIDPERIVFPYTELPCFENEKELNSILEKIEFAKDSFSCVKKGGQTVKISDQENWRGFLREAYRNYHKLIGAVAEMDTEPVSRQFGTERGTPIDRYYIEEFLKENQKYITGDVLEIEDSFYTEKFGRDQVCRSIVMDVNSKDSGVSFNGNLETGEGIQDEIADCFILTQTLMYIFDLKSAAHNISRLLKRGGAALITCSGISQNSRRCMDDYGCHFNFNEKALARMFREERSLEVVESGSFGNVKTVTAHIGGVCREDLKLEDFLPNDKYYPLIVYVVVKKR